jgi:2-oxo-3-hexenedioate decarboxylase
MDEAGLLGCVEWVAHGFEIVQSVFPGWRFAAPDATAAFGLHGALLVGPHLPLAGAAPDEIARALARFSLTLARDGEPVDEGHARNVLGGPLLALRHLVETLAREADAPPLQAGEVVTTGTLTDAHPVVPGQVWSTQLEGLDLPGLRLEIV